MSSADTKESLGDDAAVIQDLKKRPAILKSLEAELIAIVGIGCRYPGGIVDAETFWRLLEEGIDAVTEVPRERWAIDALYDPDPAALGKMTTRCGGFLPEIDRFDAGFFGISPREAVSLDPQQRLLLETSWEALEHAGIAAERLEGSGTGVFIGLMSHEYGTYGTLASGLERLDGYVGTGSLASVASGRISYVLGLQGPSMTVDTACSSSLLSTHLACQSLRQGECSLALAGGVTLMLTPGLFVEFSRLRGLAADGRCKTFSANADGTGWSEGCGMVVLERLSDARRNGHRVLAVIRGSAVNQDGRSNGLTAPNGPAQEAVIRRALADAGVKPSEIGYVECHGTGTRLGDPIEVQALGAVLREGRAADCPVVIGSLKSNLGHSQAAAGVGGLIKVVLALQHDRIPKNLHFDAPSPHIPWADLPVKVASEAMAWARNGAARIAGVSSFGVSGTNAHVVVEEAPAEVEAAPPAAVSRAGELVVLSAKSAEALDAAASRLADHVKAHPEQALGDIAFSLATTRSHHEHRLALAVGTRAELLSGLEAASRGELPGGASREGARSRGRRAWLFTGQGSQHVGMGRGLWEEWPAFREAFDAACAALDPHLEAPLREVMWAASQTARLDETGWTQPSLFALQVGLSALWRSWGIEPDVVAGHSVGELSAAYVAGVFSLEDAARLVAARGRLMQALPRGGAMVSIAASEAEVSEAVAAQAGRVSIAAVNGPLSVVISGEDAGVLAVSEAFAASGSRTKRLTVSHAFHSALMDPMLEEFCQVAEQVAYQPARIEVVSNVSGQAARSELSTAEYWVRHVREAVRFAAGVGALHAAGVAQYLEIGPKPTLLGLVPACLPLEAQEPVLVASLRAERSEAVTILEALGAHHVRGGQVQWDGVLPNGGSRVELPRYPWQRKRYWIESSGLQARSGEATGHPLPVVEVSRDEAPATRQGGWAREVALLPAERRLEAALEAVRAEVARVLSMDGAQAIGTDRPLKELGLDSMMALELRNALGKRVGATLPATLAFDYPTPAAIAKHVLEQVLSVSEAPGASAPVIVARPVEEPIAIVGIGCRYPGGIVDAETFWRLLEEGIDAVTEVPRERWDIDALYDPDPAAPGKMTTRCGGFLPEIDRFDAGFFGISPREAVSLDPQQRLLLETSWEALEHAGIAAEQLEGSGTGVFVGLMSHEYGTYGTLASGLERLDGYVGTGSLASVASGRISYVLGLQGPSMTVDTACSSSLLSTHLACQSLRQGECSLALAGGVTLMLTPGLFVEFSRLRGLAADGRCKTFSANADGTGWSEGCGMIVLERLSDARRNGHRVLAVIRGSAVNQDGRSNGLTAPNGPAQEAVIRRALADAGVKPSEIGYVECHGTGTRLGDPIEVQALGAVLREGRAADCPVVIGSLKSNLGHSQAAAGVGGLIKVVLSLQHGRIPKNLHFDAPSPHIAWADLPVKVASEAMTWSRNGTARIAGVSSFGVSGTNAHVVVEEAPAEVEAAPQAASPRTAELVVLSAKSAAALDAAASRLADHVQAHPEQALGDIAYSLATTRSHHEHRLALAVGTRAELLSGLEAASRGETVEGLSRDQVRKGRRKIVFVFPGQGSQWLGMGRDLMAEEPVFRETLEACSAAIELETGWSVIEELKRVGEESRLGSIEVVQPTLFAMEIALSALWRSWGVEPDAVVGHSMGEVAAACVSGALTLADATKVICRRSILLKRIQGQGEMALVQLPAEAAAEALAGYEAQLSVAVSNSRRSTVLSGQPAALEAVLAKLEASGVFCKRVKVDVASHSPQVDVLRKDLLSALAQVSPRSPEVAMRSTVTSRAIGANELNATYWAENLRQPVRLAEVVEGLLGEGHEVFVEISPHPILLPALEELCGDSDVDALAVGSLLRERPERASMLASAGKLHVLGCPLRLERLYSNGGSRVELPRYPWQRKRYWIESSGLQARSGEATGHPLLGVRVSMAGADVVFESLLSRAEHPWLYDHCVGEQVLMPGAGLGELARAAGEHCLGGAAVE